MAACLIFSIVCFYFARKLQNKYNQIIDQDPEEDYFDATKLDFDDEIKVINNKLLIIEGTYSMHPKFINYYDFKIFVTLDEKLQIERLKNRNPLLLDRFINEWIPKEEAYFDKFDTLKSADKVITSRIN